MLSHALVAVLLLAAPPAADPALVGTWGMGGHALFVFRADGSGLVVQDSVLWRADGKSLTVTFASGERETIPYVLAGAQLSVTMGGTPMALQRIGTSAAAGGGAAAAPREPAGGHATAPAPPATQTAPGRDPLSQLLLSSAWCSFHYNQITGASSSERFQFFADGTWSNGARSEGYSSGGGGTFSSQHNSGAQGRWESRAGGNELWMSSRETNGQLVQLPLVVKRNSSGYPILMSDKKEYSMCR